MRKGCTLVKMSLCIGWPQSKGRGIADYCLPVQAEPVERAGFLELRVEMLWHEVENLIERGNCVIKVRTGQHTTLFEPCVSIFRGVYEKTIKCVCCLPIPFQCGKRGGPEVKGAGVLSITGKGDIERRNSIPVFPGIEKCSPTFEIRYRIRWRKLKYPIERFDGFIVFIERSKSPAPLQGTLPVSSGRRSIAWSNAATAPS